MRDDRLALWGFHLGADTGSQPVQGGESRKLQPLLLPDQLLQRHVHQVRGMRLHRRRRPHRDFRCRAGLARLVPQLQAVTCGGTVALLAPLGIRLWHRPRSEPCLITHVSHDHLGNLPELWDTAQP